MADQDMRSATKTYEGFTTLAKTGVVVTALVVMLVIVLIS